MPAPVPWHFVVTDNFGTAIGEITNATERQAVWNLSDAGTVSFTMDAMDPQSDFVQETITDLMLYRGSVLLFRGRFGASQDTVGTSEGGEPSQHTVQFSVTDYRGMLGRRIITDPPPTFTNVDQSAIAWQLINASQGQQGGYWGITQGSTPASVQRTITEAGGTYIEQAIDDIATLDAGFDWEISPLLKFNTWPIPSKTYIGLGRGQNIGAVLTYGDNVYAAVRTLDTTQFANVVRYSANVTTGSVQTDVVSEALYTGDFGAAGRWEYQASNNNINDATSVANAAIATLTQMAALLPSYQLYITPGWWNNSLIWLGDLVQVNVKHGRLNDSFVGRVSQIQLQLGDDAGEEQIIITVGPLAVSLLARILANEKLLNRVLAVSN